jgi:hypothetical protein
MLSIESRSLRMEPRLFDAFLMILSVWPIPMQELSQGNGVETL